MKQLDDVLEKTMRVVSRQAGIKVVCKGNSTPCTDGRTIYLPSLPVDCPANIARVYHGCCDHELAHVLYSDFSPIKDFKKKHGGHGFQVLNILEDLRIEQRLEADFLGSKKNLADAYADIQKRWIKNMSTLPLWNRLIGCIFATGKSWDTSIYGDDATLLVDEVRETVLRALQATTTQAVVVLAEEILARWKRLLKAQVEPEQEDDDDSLSDQQLIDLFGEVDSTNPLSLEANLQGSLGEMNESPTLSYRVYDRSQDRIVKAPDGGIDSYKRLLGDVSPYVGTLRRRLMMTLRGMSQSRWVSDDNGSKLNRKKLHNLCFDAPCSPFISKTSSPSNDVAVSLLIDQSGSMAREPIELAKKCTALLAETMDQLGLKLEIIGFTTLNDDRYLGELRKTESESPEEIQKRYARYIPTLHIVYKEFSEKWEPCRGRIESMEALNYTPINESTLLAAKRLLAVKASRRILIVLTDGAAFVGKTLQHLAQQNLADNLEILDKAKVEVLAIGLRAPYVREVFRQSIVVDKLAQLPQEFFGAISKKLLGRK